MCASHHVMSQTAPRSTSPQHQPTNPIDTLGQPTHLPNASDISIHILPSPSTPSLLSSRVPCPAAQPCCAPRVAFRRPARRVVRLSRSLRMGWGMAWAYIGVHVVCEWAFCVDFFLIGLLGCWTLVHSITRSLWFVLGTRPDRQTDWGGTRGEIHRLVKLHS